MWSYFLISFLFQLAHAYYLGSTYYQKTQYFPQFYAPTNDAPLICFVYFPGFAYYPQMPAQQEQYPVLAPFYGHSIYQAFLPHSDSSRPWAPKTSVEQSKQPFDADAAQPLSVIGVPVIITKIKGGQQSTVKEHLSNKVDREKTTQTPTTIPQLDSETINTDTTNGQWSLQEKNTEQPQRQTPSEKPSPGLFITIPLFVTQTITTENPVREPEEISPSVTTEFTLIGKEWEHTDPPILPEQNESEKQFTSIVPEIARSSPKEWGSLTTSFDKSITEVPSQISKEWIPAATSIGTHLVTTTESQSDFDGSGSGDGRIPNDDEDGFNI